MTSGAATWAPGLYTLSTTI